MTRATLRLAPIAVALATVVGVVWLLATRTPAHQAPLPSVLAYRTLAGEPVGFRTTGDEELVLTTHLVVPPSGRTRPLRYAVVVLAEDLGGLVRWRGRAVVETTPGPALAGDEPLTHARALAIPRDAPAPGGQLVVLVEASLDARGAVAVLRLGRRAARPGGRGERPAAHDELARATGDRASLFGWPYLPEADLQAAAARPTGRATAIERGGVVPAVVHVTVPPEEPEPVTVAPLPGEVVSATRAAAWTARGPGRLRVSVAPLLGEGDARVRLRTIDQDGITVELSLDVPVRGPDPSFDVPTAGALTVEAFADGARPLLVRVFAEDGAVPLGDAPPPTAAGELAPDRRRVPLWRLLPGGSPLRATFAGSGVTRLQLRPPLEPALGAGPVPFRWRILEGDRILAAGGDVVPATPAIFERYHASADPAGPPPSAPAAAEPHVFVASGPPGAVLELTPLRAALDVGLAAEDDAFVPRLAPAYDLDLENARLRFAPRVRRRWVPFLPDNHAELAAAGGRVVLEGQVRLEPLGPDDELGGPYRAAEPRRPRTRRTVLEQARTLSDTWRPQDRAVLVPGRATRLVVPARGPEAGRLAIDYRSQPTALGSELTVRVDGEVASRRRLAFTRGRLRLVGLAPGPHELLIDGPPALLTTSARPVPRTRAGTYVERRAWRIAEGARGALEVPVGLGAWETKFLSAVVYVDEDPGRIAPLRVRFTIDGRARPAALRPSVRTTRTDRVLESPAAPTSGFWLEGPGGPRGAARFVVRLGPDLGPGAHRVRVTLERGPRRAHVRFAVSGTGRVVPAPRFGIEWDEE